MAVISRVLKFSRDILEDTMDETDWELVSTGIPQYLLGSDSKEQFSQSQIQAARKALSIDPSNWRAMYNLSQEVGTQEAISILKNGIERLGKDSTWVQAPRHRQIYSLLLLELTVQYLDTNKAEDFDLAIQSLSTCLQTDASTAYPTVIGIVLEAEKREKWDDIIALNEMLNQRRDSWPTCKLMLEKMYCYAIFNDAIVRAAEATSRMDILELIYQPAIDMAINNKAHDELCWLRYCYSYGLSYQKDNENRVLQLWEEVMEHLPKLQYNKESFLWAIHRYLAPTYLEKAVEAGSDSEVASSYLSKIRSMQIKGDGGDRNQAIYLWAALMNTPALYLARYYQIRGSTDRARKEIVGTMKKCLEMLSDDDPSNDLDAYIMVCAVCATCDDEENSIAAFQLLELNAIRAEAEYQKKKKVARAKAAEPASTTVKTDEPTAAGDFKETEAGSPNSVIPSENPLGNGDTPSVAKNGDVRNDDRPAAVVPLPQQPSTREHDADEDAPEQPYSGLVCDGGCDEELQKGDAWCCKDCAGQLMFDENCYQKVLQGTMTRRICGKSHKFLKISKVEPEKAETIPVGSIYVGDKIMTLEEWKGSLRVKYLDGEA
jgi:hypothetical protein